MSEWQPIESAPKDGTRILLYYPIFGRNPHQEFGKWELQKHNNKPAPYWSGDGERLYGVQWYRSFKPTHWRPQYDAPKEPTT